MPGPGARHPWPATAYWPLWSSLRPWPPSSRSPPRMTRRPDRGARRRVARDEAEPAHPGGLPPGPGPVGRLARRARRAPARGGRDRRSDVGPAPGGRGDPEQHRGPQADRGVLVLRLGARRGHAAANPVAGLARPAVDYDTSATPGLTRDQAVALLEAADADAGPQAARTAALVAALLLPGRGSRSCSARTSRTWAPTAATGCCGSAARAARSRPWPCPPRPPAGSRPTWPAGTTSPRCPPSRAAGGRAAAAGAVRHRHRGADVPGRGPRPAAPPRPRRRPPPRPSREPVAALDAARLRHAESGRRGQPAGPAGRPGPRLPAHHPALRPQPRQPGPLPRLPPRRVHQPPPSALSRHSWPRPDRPNRDHGAAVSELGNQQRKFHRLALVGVVVLVSVGGSIAGRLAFHAPGGNHRHLAAAVGNLAAAPAAQLNPTQPPPGVHAGGHQPAAPANASRAESWPVRSISRARAPASTSTPRRASRSARLAGHA